MEKDLEGGGSLGEKLVEQPDAKLIRLNVQVEALAHRGDLLYKEVSLLDLLFRHFEGNLSVDLYLFIGKHVS